MSLAGKNTLSSKHIKRLFRAMAQAPGALVIRNTVFIWKVKSQLYGIYVLSLGGGVVE